MSTPDAAHPDAAHPGAAFWDRIAEKYAARPVADPAAFDRKIAITREHMTPDSVVLDIGCGTGSLALRLADAGREVHGLDVSPEMIRIAEGKAEQAGVANARFHVGPFDERFTAFEDGALDGVCAYSILHLVDDRHAAMRQIFRLLRPGGFFISSTPCLGRGRLLFGPMLWLMRLFGKAPPVSLFTAATLLEDMRAAGFADAAPVDVGAKPEIAFVVAHKPA